MTSFAIIPRGGFGNELSDRLELAADVTRARSPADAFKSGADVVIAALHREDRRLLATCDGAAFANSIRLLPVVLEPGWIRCGPLVDPVAGGPCYGCFVVRRHQRGVEDAVNHPADTCLSRQAELAVRMVARMSSQHAAGQVLECSLDHGDLRSATLFGVAGCPRCSRPAADRGDRFLREIRAVRAPGPAALDGAPQERVTASNLV